MTVEDLIIFGKKHLSKTHAEMLLASLLGCNTLELLLKLDEIVPEDIMKRYQQQIIALEQKKPIQYVIGNVNFYGQTFDINENVLIPRFETEELVEQTVSKIKKHFPHPISMIDLGTGSGVIGLTIKRLLPSSQVTMVDISTAALEVAKQNAEKQQLEVTFIESDMWDRVSEVYDVVISNPPYIKTNEEIDPLVKDNEPSLALYGGEDGLDCYRKILKDIRPHLKKDYLIAFEIGCDQKEALSKLVRTILPDADIECIQDLQGRDRIFFVTNHS